MSYIQTDMTQREVELNTLVTRYRTALEEADRMLRGPVSRAEVMQAIRNALNQP